MFLSKLFGFPKGIQIICKHLAGGTRSRGGGVLADFNYFI
jgi:hypothetical protein